MHPAFVLPVLVLLLNDHWAKAAFPGWITGKLSDVAGLCFFPLLLQAAWEIALRTRPNRRVLFAAVAGTGLAFALVKTVPIVTWAYAATLGALQAPWALVGASRSRAVTDPSDLLALPALLLPLLLGLRRSRRFGSQATSQGADRARTAG